MAMIWRAAALPSESARGRVGSAEGTEALGARNRSGGTRATRAAVA
jgi:hypothetical protein